MSLLEEKTKKVLDNYDLLQMARMKHRELKMSGEPYIYVNSKVYKVDDRGFYITPDLKIAVGSIKHLKQQFIEEADISDVLKGALSHEDAHAFAFPFMTRMNLIYAVARGYVKNKGLPWVPDVFNSIENIVSDVINELIIFWKRLPGHDVITKTRYLYVVLPQIKRGDTHQAAKKDEVKKDPIASLFTVHNKVFSSIHLNKETIPIVRNPTTLSEHIYNAFSEAARGMNLASHMSLMLGGGLSRTIGNMIYSGELYRDVDEFYELLVKYMKSDPDSSVGDNVRSILTKGKENEKIYRAYFVVLLSFYRYVFEQIKSHSYSFPLPSIDQSVRPAPAPDDVLDAILIKLVKASPDLLDSSLADYAAKRIINKVLMTLKPTVLATTSVAEAHMPLYKAQRGKVIPQSLMHPSLFDWKVKVKIRVPDEKTLATSYRGLPDSITIVIDESGSTETECSVLSSIVGVDTTVYDVERVTAMALLYNVMLYDSSIRTTLVRFSSEAVVDKGAVKDIYEWLKTADKKQLMFGGTEIVKAVDEALKHHRDGPENYFIVMTDMEIPIDDAAQLYEKLKKRLPQSPKLVLAANAPIPQAIEPLNKEDNAAAVSVRTISDYAALEEAITKLAKIIHK